MRGCDSESRNNASGKVFHVSQLGIVELCMIDVAPVEWGRIHRKQGATVPSVRIITLFCPARQFHSAKCRSPDESCTIPGIFESCFAIPFPLLSPFQPNAFKSEALPPILMKALISSSRCQREEADKAIQELLKLNPTAAQIVRSAMQRIFESEFVEQMIDGLRKAGLEIPQD